MAEPWHGIKRCVSGTKIPKMNRVMGQPCPYCGNTLGATIGTASPSEDLQTKLKNLQQHRDAALLTDAEYSKMRAALLDDAVKSPAAATNTTELVAAQQSRRSRNRNAFFAVAVVVIALGVIGAIAAPDIDPESAPAGPSSQDLFVEALRIRLGATYPNIDAVPDLALLDIGRNLCTSIGSMRESNTDPSIAADSILTTAVTAGDDPEFSLQLTVVALVTVGATICPDNDAYINRMIEYIDRQ